MDKKKGLIALAGLAFLAIVFFVLKKLKTKKVETGSTKYIDGLPDAKKENAKIFLDTMKQKGITNPFTQAAIMAVISKESEFMPKSENLNYTSAQMQKVFGLKKETADKLVGNQEAIGNAVYGDKGGNGPNEGYKYRGRGLNQITFKETYSRIGKQIGQDLVSNPDLLNNIHVASAAAIQFFQNGIDAGKALGKLSQYNSTGMNDFKSVKDALGAVYNINTGWGSSKAKIVADVTGGLKKATERVGDIYNYIKTVS